MGRRIAFGVSVAWVRPAIHRRRMAQNLWDLWQAFNQNNASGPDGTETMEQAIRLLYPIDGRPVTRADLQQANDLANAAHAEGGRVLEPLATAIKTEIAKRMLAI